MTKLRKSAIGMLAVLSAGCLAASTVAYAFSGNGKGTPVAAKSAINRLNANLDTGIENYYDGNVVYRLPETVASDEEISVIVAMNVDSLNDVYQSSSYNGTLQSFLKTETAKAAENKIEKQRKSLLKTLDEAGVSYTLGEKYGAVLSGFEISVKASDFAAVNSLLEGDKAQLIVGESYQRAETQVVTNEVDVYGTGIFDSSSSEYQGDGVVVAVLDTGCDYTHTAFAKTDFDEAFTLGTVSSLVGNTLAAQLTPGLTGNDVYVSKKIPFAYDYADNDSDVAPINSEHGTHVAGIIAGDDDEITGVAPHAQLAIMKVFSDTEENAKSSWILSAVEDCVRLGVDIINMSLGTSCGFSRELDNDRMNALYESVKEAGISLIVAASNSYNATFASEKNGNLGLTSNPDSGTVGSPSTYVGALSVASVDGVKTPYLKYGDDIIYFTESMNAAAKKKNFVNEVLSTVGNADSYDFEYVTIPGLGRSSDYIEEGDYYHDKIVLVKRGTTTFEEKIRVALQEKGAAGIIVYNNVSGTISMSVGKDMGAACSISQEEGEKLAAAESGILHISRDQTAGPFMSDFSSWGPTSDLKIKPEITAHGGEIYSCIPGQRYDRISGTSMACPNQAGATALIRQFVKYSGTFGNLDSKEDAQKVTSLVNQLMMSTADIVYNKNGLPYAVRKQGAGLMNILSATTTASYITTYEKDSEGNAQPMDKTKIELGDDKNKTGVYEAAFDVTNVSASAASYDLSAVIMTEGVSPIYTSHGDTTVTEDGYLLDGTAFDIVSVNGGTLGGSTLTVAAGQTAKVSVKITLSAKDKEYLDKSFENGMYVEGFIMLKASAGTSVNLNVPLLAFYGDWTEAPIFDEEYYDTNADELDAGIDPENKLMADAYPTRVFGGIYSDYITTLGTYAFKQDPSLTSKIAADKNKIAISNQEGDESSPINSIRSIAAGLLRNSSEIVITVTEDATGRQIYTDTVYNQRKSYSNGTSIYSSPFDFVFSAYRYNLKNNTKYTVTAEAYIDYGSHEEQKNKRNVFSFPLYIDFEAPVVTDVVYRTEYDRTTKKTKLYADLDIYDNHYAMSAQIGQVVDASSDYPDEDYAFNSFGKYMTPIHSSFNSTSTITVELTDYVSLIKNSVGMAFDANGNDYKVRNTNAFVVTCYDYAMNYATYEITLPDEILSMYFEQNGEAIDEISLSPNETLDLTTVLKVYPEESWPQTLDYAIENNGGEAVATVVNQTLVAIAKGEAILTVSGKDKDGNGVNTSVKITVLGEGDEGYVGGYSMPQVNKFILTSYTTNKAYYSADSDEREIGETGSENPFGSAYSLSMYPSESVTVNYVLDSYFPERTSVRYTVGNSRVATVDENGTIVAQAEGTTRVTASVRFDGGNTLYSEIINVTVKDPYSINSIYLASYKGLGGTVEIPDDRGITTISAYAFSNYKFVDKDTSAGDIIDEEDPYYMKQQYLGEDTITKIVIPENVVEIQSYAFAGLSALEEVVLPTTLKRIGVGAFLNCTSLKKINLGNVQFINQEAFRNCGFESVNLSSVVAIGNYTFANTKLLSLTLPASSQSLGEGAFSNNLSLSSVTFKAEKIKMSRFAFAGCGQIRSVKVNAAVVPSYAFYGCTNLRTVELGKDVSVIGEYAFTGTSVSRFTLDGANTVLSLKNNGADIYEGDKLVLKAPSGTRGEITIDATEIASGAFAGNTRITAVHAPNATYVGPNAFIGCTSLAEVDMPKLERIGEHAFDGTALASTPDLTHVTEIGAYAFASTTLTEVEIPAGATVGEAAFYNCLNLQTVTVGDNAVIGYGAFSNNVENYTYESINDERVFYMFYTEYTYEVKDANGTVMETLQFYRYNIDNPAIAPSVLTTVSIGANVSIGEHAFSGNVKLNSLTLGGGAKIGNYAFFNDVALTAADLSAATTIGGYAFSGTTAYDYYRQAYGAEVYYTRAMNYYYEDGLYYASTYLSTYFSPALTEVDLSNVSEIGEGSFAYNTHLTDVKFGELKVIAPLAFAVNTSLNSITLPASATQIGEYAFYSDALTAVDLSNAEIIGYNAFGHNELVSVKLKEGVLIGDFAFAENYNLAEVTNLEKAVYFGAYSFFRAALEELTLTDAEFIGDFAFAQSAVTKVSFGSSLVELGENPFFACNIETYGKSTDLQFNGNSLGSELTEDYDISEYVKVIGGVLYQTVEGGLELVSYPLAKQGVSYAVAEGTRRICANAFAGAVLENVTIASTVKSIGDKAFYGCPNLAVVIFLSYDAPILEEEYDEEYANTGDNFPINGQYFIYEGLGIVKYFSWTLFSGNNFYYGANFVDYIGHISDNIVMVKPANGQNYSSFILSQYFGTTVNGSNAAMEATLAVIGLIDKIPSSITLADEAVIVAAREAYDNIPSLEQQSLVANLSKLSSAESTLLYLKNREEQGPNDNPVHDGGNGAGFNIVAYIGYILAGIAVIALIAYIAVTQIKNKKSVSVAEGEGNNADDGNKNDSDNSEENA